MLQNSAFKKGVFLSLGIILISACNSHTPDTAHPNPAATTPSEDQEMWDLVFISDSSG